MRCCPSCSRMPGCSRPWSVTERLQPPNNLQVKAGVPVGHNMEQTSKPRSGTLYLCPTPIGNLQDITLRVLDTLRQVDLIAAEDTRRTRKLLSHYQIGKPLWSYHEHNRQRREKEILSRLGAGDSVALVSDAGTPAVADPGRELVVAAAQAGFAVLALPGPSALLTALGISGMVANAFFFGGYPPRSSAERQGYFARLAGEIHTSILYEAPHRLLETLDDLYHYAGDRQLVVARELTKLHEEVRRGVLSEHCLHFRQEPPRGEFTLVLAGAPAGSQDELDEAYTKAVALGEELCRAGLSHRDAVRIAAGHRGVQRARVYQALL